MIMTTNRDPSRMFLRTLLIVSIVLLLQPTAIQCHQGSRTPLRGAEDTAQDSEKNMEQSDHAKILELANKMKPRPLRHHHHHDDEKESKEHDDDGDDKNYHPHQSFHLHHMKSGGTSLSNWISCGVRRQQKIHNLKIATTGLSECAYDSYHKCIKQDNNSCRNRIENAVTMNFCSPLAVTNYFNWTEADAVTMMRHPVDRVWSMFRFQTKSCFKCTNLTQVYEDMDKGDTEKYGGGVCLAQLSNHITRNLQQNINVTELDTFVMSDEERVADAINSIQNRMTVVGVMEHLNETLKQFSYTFPWLKEKIHGSDQLCKFPHSNGSPKNNRCAPGNKHWDLPSKPDEATRKAIEEHNKLDILVYEAALKRFELQKQSMSLEENLQ